MKRSLDKEVLVDAPLDAVWDAWTTRDGTVGFLAPDAEIDARPDGSFRVVFDPSAATGRKGADTMRSSPSSRRRCGASTGTRRRACRTCATGAPSSWCVSR